MTKSSTSTCSNGLEGQQDSNAFVCCVSGCDLCGGGGCAGNNGLSADDCCVTSIVSNGLLCSETGSAPCVLETSSSTGATALPASTPAPRSSTASSSLAPSPYTIPATAPNPVPTARRLQLTSPPTMGSAAPSNMGFAAPGLPLTPPTVGSAAPSNMGFAAPGLPLTPPPSMGSAAPTVSPTASTIVRPTPAPLSPTAAPTLGAMPDPMPPAAPSPAPETAAPTVGGTSSPISMPLPVSAPAVSPSALPATPGLTFTSSSTPIISGVASAVAAAVLTALGLWFRKRRIENMENNIGRQTALPVVVVDRGDGPRPPHHHPSTTSPLYPHTLVTAGDINGGVGGVVSPSRAALAGELRAEIEATTPAGKDGGGGRGDGAAARAESDADDGADEPSLPVTTSTINTLPGERDERTQAYRESGVPGALFVADEPRTRLDGVEASSSTCRRGSSGGLGLGHAVAEAAQELARNCNIPGVTEVAATVSILANLVTNDRDNAKSTEASLKRCRSIVTLLQRAAMVLGKASDTHREAEHVLMGEVQEAIFDLVELIKTYQSKNKLSQLLMSTLFKRRQDEMGAIVDRAVSSMQFGLHVQVAQDVNAFKEGMNLQKESTARTQSEALAEARSARRQRKLDQIEIPEEHVAITDELLGKGGFGEVYLADYNGRNAAAKIFYINDNLGRRGEKGVLDASKGDLPNKRQNKSLRKAVLLELDAMIRLRNPYTVNVYGAVTSLPDCMILVMELLAGGDLRTLLNTFEQPLPDEQSRQIIGDICNGMAFLHRKKTVHGALKSANVLLDYAGRAKIGDFGTSRWTQHTMSTGLATFTTKSSQNTHMSLAWSAPEVLHAAGNTYASDVFSFGIVVWEVLSRQLPWATVTHPRDIYIRVVLNELRPTIPDDAHADIADVARACWAAEPGDRPTFSAIVEGMKSNPWNL